MKQETAGSAQQSHQTVLEHPVGSLVMKTEGHVPVLRVDCGPAASQTCCHATPGPRWTAHFKPFNPHLRAAGLSF